MLPTQRVAMRKFKNKPKIIEALQFTGINYSECEAFIGKDNYDNTLNYPNIKTLEGVMSVCVGDYIVKGIRGEFYPVKPDIFLYSYEEID